MDRQKESKLNEIRAIRQHFFLRIPSRAKTIRLVRANRGSVLTEPVLTKFYCMYLLLSPIVDFDYAFLLEFFQLVFLDHILIFIDAFREDDLKNMNRCDVTSLTVDELTVRCNINGKLRPADSHRVNNNKA
jgi:hypothetical protein